MDFRGYIDLVEAFNWDENTILFELFDVEKFLNRAKAVQQLIVRGATEGERDGARLAMDRLIARAESEIQELDTRDRDAFRRRFDAIRAETTSKAEPARPRPRPSYNEPPPQPRRDQADADAEYARKKSEQGREQNSDAPKILSYAEFREGTSDKVYGVVRKNNRIYTFWGRNGASLATKEQESVYAAHAIFQSKIRKGYREAMINPYIEREVIRNLRF